MLFACWLWLAGVILATALAWAEGADARSLALAAAFALAPALALFILAPRFGQRAADVGCILAWLATAIALAAISGGAASPMVAALAIAPAMALALGRRWAPEAGAGAVLGLAAAAAWAHFQAPASLGIFPQALAAVSLALAAGLMALSQRDAAATQVMGRRLAEVSHELRTPLTHILGFAEMVERQIFGEIGARYVEYAGLIRRSGAHLLGLVNDLLDLSRIEAGRYELDLESFDARAVIEDVVRLSVDAAARKQIALGMVTPDAPLIVEADARALRRILINTLGNALKFTPEGGKVIVAAAVVDGALQLDTIDNGPGFPAADREKLGQAFERGAGRAQVEGAGLGLALVSELARLHGGRLSLLDAPGGGALARIVLPVLKGD
ncbi:MAG: sensor histidine kinase [Vitreimonas sp.]